MGIGVRGEEVEKAERKMTRKTSYSLDYIFGIAFALNNSIAKPDDPPPMDPSGSIMPAAPPAMMAASNEGRIIGDRMPVSIGVQQTTIQH